MTISLIRCFPHILSTRYDEEFQDEGNDQSLLGQGTFQCWSYQAIPFVVLLWGHRFLGVVCALQIRATVWVWLVIRRQPESSSEAYG